MIILYLLVAAVLLLSFANGGNDVSKGIATLVGSGVTSYRKAIVWGTIWTVAGGLVASVFALELVRTFSASGIVKSSEDLTKAFPAAISLGAFAWVMFTARTGLPVSTTHSIAGAICGTGVAAVGIDGITWVFLGKKIFLPLLFSPLIALGISWLLAPIISKLASRLERYCLCIESRKKVVFKPSLSRSGNMAAMSQIASSSKAGLIAGEKAACEASGATLRKFEVLDILHWLSAGTASFARGLNDAPKIAALALGAGALGTGLPVSYAFLIVALAMGAGSIIAGLKVTETLSEKVTPMNAQEGFSANLTTSVLVMFASRLGMPVSTTHVSSGAIIGIGIKHGAKTVKWKMVLEMVFGWIITLPVTALLGYLIYRFLN
jgi:inorganic phosphate transporter, PiT family